MAAGDGQRLLVDLDRDHPRGAQDRRRRGEDAAARAHVEHVARGVRSPRVRSGRPGTAACSRGCRCRRRARARRRGSVRSSGPRAGDGSQAGTIRKPPAEKARKPSRTRATQSTAAISAGAASTPRPDHRLAQPGLETGLVREVGKHDGAAALGRERLRARGAHLPERGGERLLVLRRQEEAEGLQPRMSFTLPRNERSFSCTSAEGSVLASWSMQPALLGGELGGHHHAHRHVEVAAPAPAEVRHALPAHAERGARSACPPGTVSFALPPSTRRHLDRGAERGLRRS